jgi:SAM-dependent methyltransferase
MNDTQDIQVTETHRNGEAQRRCAPASCYASLPPVLDACCSCRSFWFDRKDSRTLFVDKRRETCVVDVGSPGTIGRKPLVIDPDVMADFTALPFPDESFFHVVFDPPHVAQNVTSGALVKRYGILTGDWREMLRKGFAECFRVLKPGGTLIFKWCEVRFPIDEILALTPERPLYGHRSGKKAQTHWVAFLKHNIRS